VNQRVFGLGFLATCVLAYPIQASAPAAQGTAYLLLHSALSVWMLASWLGRDPDSDWVLGVGVLARLVLVGVAPFTTHDVERYLWDGAVVLAGYDPYLLAPAAPTLADLRTVWPTSAAHVEFTTIYPPGALALFTMASSAGVEHAPVVWKILVTVASIATLFVAAALLRRRGLGRHLPLVALSPLLVLESGIGAHLDAFSTLALVTALWALDHRRVVVAGAALAAGILAKFLPAVVLLPLVLVLRRWEAAVLAGVVATVTVGGYAVAAACGLWPLGGLAAFFTHARFGSPLAALFDMSFGSWGLIVGGLVVVAVVLVATIRAASRGTVDRALQYALAMPLLVSPVVYPWYLTPLAVCTALSPSAVVLIWTLTLPLTYEVLNELGATGDWTPARWPLVVIAFGWMLGGAIDELRVRRAT